ncbi:MAG: hypothetical protein ACW987_00515 [Candidatus Thorarchaeota archaeon]|jgi:hypothetical protein
MGHLVYFEHNNVSLVRDTFIETGTFKGESLINANKQGFRELHSIEVEDSNFKEVATKFKDIENIHVYHGSSPDILPTIIDPKKSTTFWLDAHYQGGRQEEQGDGQCPLIDELNIVFSYDWESMPYILIDDSDIFKDRKFMPNKGFIPEQWPTVDDIKKVIPDSYTVSFDTNNIMYCLPLV